jgi:hypothetical protein
MVPDTFAFPVFLDSLLMRGSTGEAGGKPTLAQAKLSSFCPKVNTDALTGNPFFLDFPRGPC